METGAAGLGKRTRKKTKGYYAKKKKDGSLSSEVFVKSWNAQRQLNAGMSGVLITTGDQEKFCIPEAYNLLNEYGDKLYGPESTSVNDSDDDGTPDGSGAADIASAVAEEVAKLKGSEEKPRRFQAVQSGAKHVVFIQCNDPVDPCQLVHHMLTDISDTGVKKSRFCQRVLPVVKVCHATLEDIRKNAVSVLEPHFYTDDLVIHKFAVSYKARNNNDVKRDDIIKLLANMVTREGDFAHVVDLSNPELTVVVEIIKNLCCLSVVRDFQKLKKYNIHSITEPVVQATESSKTGSPGQQQDSSTSKEKQCSVEEKSTLPA